MKKNTALMIAGVVFLLLALGHGLRLYYGLEIVVGTYTVPLWFSYAGLVIALLLAIWMFLAGRR